MNSKEERKNINYFMTTSRLEAFSDGVFSIAITLLILEVKIPKHEDLLHSGGLYNYLTSIWPSYLAYAISFLVIGIYWSNHHWLYSFIKKTDHVFNLLNILFLMTVSFMPFTTAILGDFISDPLYRNASVTAYCIGYVLPPAIVIIMVLYAGHHNRLMDPLLSRSFKNRFILKLLFGMLLMGSAIALSFNYPMISIFIIGFSLIMFLLPPTKPIYNLPKQSSESGN